MGDQPEVVAQWERHPKFYWEDDGRMVVYRAENMLFRVTVSPFCLHSVLVNDLMELSMKLPSFCDERNYQALLIKAGNGGSPSEPIFLDGVTAKGFETILEWIWHTPSFQTLTLSPDMLIMLLRASRWLIMPDCSRWAIDRLKTLDPPLSAVDRLGFTTTLPIFDVDWLHPAIDELVRMGPEKLSSRDMSALGGRIVGIIGAAHSRILRERARISQSIPDVPPSSSCHPTRHQRVCVPYWTELWWNVVGRRLIDPDDPIPLSEVADLVDRSPSGELRSSCKLLYIQAWRNSTALTVEHRIIDSAILSIVAYLRSLHMDPDQFAIPAS
ncbi:hypothetical protein K435DRAFT_867944 [Dendrothele bispora CBS 962.96]|uniref:BTB domain-containing protein n=1 Tax=Dendrothele bispora (strain CBS 962.96) TaxID=1314807 RepID=A0A4S8LD15_DENBC|nr:hypothetical protein K435DRAFT_867944 [Dendrothele bispora CBS 962.96]